MNLTIKYEWLNLSEWMDIKDFSESLIWFSDLSKEIFKIWKIKSDIDVKVTSVKQWSIIVDLVLWITDIISSFSSLEDFLYFLELTNADCYDEITKKLEEFWNYWAMKWQNLEEFTKEHPFLMWVVWAWVYDLLIVTIKTIRDFKIKDKKVEEIPDTQKIDVWNWTLIKWEALKDMKKIVIKWKSINFLEPIIEDEITSINISSEKESVEINNSNFDYFIWKWNEILPNLINWEIYYFIGSFTWMQSNRWETISFTSEEYKTKNNQPFQFSCYLPFWRTTEDYAEFYGASKRLKVRAEVVRISEYKKPKLKILSVSLFQTALDI